MKLPSSHFDLRLNEIRSVQELSEITLGVITALEDCFGLNRDWYQIAPKASAADDQGLSPLRIASINDLSRYFIDRNWEERFSNVPTVGTGHFYNETVITQLSPKEFSIHFEHIDPDQPGGWRIAVSAPCRKLSKSLFVKCGEAIRVKNQYRSGSIHCSYKISQKQIGKYMPMSLVEEVFVYNIGKMWL